ncbi:MAG: DUF7619 domain-containing protein [Armatimonadota bacterium]
MRLLSWSGDARWYQVEVTADEPAIVLVEKDDSWPSRLSIAEGSLPEAGDGGYSDQTVELTAQSDGYAYVRVESTVSGTKHFDLRAGPPLVRSVTPTVVVADEVAEVVLTGHYLAEGAVASLRREGYAEITCSDTLVNSEGTELTAWFDLRGAPLGMWDLVVTNPSGRESLLSPGLEIATGQPQLWAQVWGPTVVRAGRPTYFEVAYGNSGNVDPYLAFLFISLSPEAECTLHVPGQDPVDNPHRLDSGDEAVICLMLSKVPPGAQSTVGLTVTADESFEIAADIAQRPDGYVDIAPSYAPDAPISGAISSGKASEAASVTQHLRGQVQTARQRSWDSRFPPFIESRRLADVPDGSAYLVRWIAMDYYSQGPYRHLWHEAYVVKEGGEAKIYQSFDWPQQGVQCEPLSSFEELAQRYQQDYPERRLVLYGLERAINPYGVGSVEEAEARMADLIDQIRGFYDRNAGTPWDRTGAGDAISCVGFTALANSGFSPTDSYRSMAIMSQWGCFARIFTDKFPVGHPDWLDYVSIVVRRSWDPNQKTHTIGHGPEGFVRGDVPLSYSVHFENDPEESSAAAYQVVVTDQLDSDLDWSSFTLTQIRVAGVDVPLPADTHSFTETIATTVPLKDVTDPDYPNCPPQDVPVEIEVACDFDQWSGVATWRFTGRDPDTGQITDFLPPNVQEDDPATDWDDAVDPHGRGWISYTCEPGSGLPEGTVIENAADITFDTNEPLTTNAVTNTIDSGAPTSSVTDLPPTSEETEFELSWAGSDDEQGSGLAEYDIFVSDNGRPYDVWVANTSAASETFTASAGHTYRFYSIARDNAGNVEETPAEPDATVVVIGPAVDVPVEMHVGWNMPSVGCPADEGASFADLLGDGLLSLFMWDAAKFQYQPVDPNTAALDHAGLGAWALCSAEGTATVPMRAPQQMQVPVASGWNLLANPFPGALDVETGLTPDGDGSIITPVHHWNAQQFTYEQMNVVPAGCGFWALATYSGTATFDPAGLTTASAAHRVASLGDAPDVPDGSTCIQLAAQAGDMRDVGTWLGIAADGDALKTPKPPMMPDAVGAYLDVQDGIGYARSIVPQGEEHTWTLTVNSPQEEDVSLRIVDTSELPGDMAVWLTDQATGTRIDLRHAPSYTYTARDRRRQFEIELGERDDLLQVMGVSAQAAGDGAQISFTLSAAGSVTVDVLNIAGRTIKRIVTDRECDPGLQTVNWNGRSERGTKVPSGMYLIRVSAAAPTGEQCQGLNTVTMR